MAALCPTISCWRVNPLDFGLQVVAFRLEPVLLPLGFRVRLPQQFLGSPALGDVLEDAEGPDHAAGPSRLTTVATC